MYWHQDNLNHDIILNRSKYIYNTFEIQHSPTFIHHALGMINMSYDFKSLAYILLCWIATIPGHVVGINDLQSMQQCRNKMFVWETCRIYDEIFKYASSCHKKCCLILRHLWRCCVSQIFDVFVHFQFVYKTFTKSIQLPVVFVLQISLFSL